MLRQCMSWIRLSKILLPILLVSSSAMAERFAVQGMTLDVPAGWKLSQQAIENNTIMLAFTVGDDIVNLYVKPEQNFKLEEFAVNDAELIDRATQNVNHHDWQVLNTLRVLSLKNDAGKTVNTISYHVSSFATKERGYAYYGYSRSESADAAKTNLETILQAIH